MCRLLARGIAPRGRGARAARERRESGARADLPVCVRLTGSWHRAARTRRESSARAARERICLCACGLPARGIAPRGRGARAARERRESGARADGSCLPARGSIAPRGRGARAAQERRKSGARADGSCLPARGSSAPRGRGARTRRESSARAAQEQICLCACGLPARGIAPRGRGARAAREQRESGARANCQRSPASSSRPVTGRSGNLSGGQITDYRQETADMPAAAQQPRDARRLASPTSHYSALSTHHFV